MGMAFTDVYLQIIIEKRKNQSKVFGIWCETCRFVGLINTRFSIMAADTKDIFRFFTENHDEIFSRFPGKFVVLHGKSVAFAKDTFDEALDAAMAAGFKPGEFLIQECTAGDSAYTQFFSSQIVFA